jgi:hypothetical protein
VHRSADVATLVVIPDVAGTREQLALFDIHVVLGHLDEHLELGGPGLVLGFELADLVEQLVQEAVFLDRLESGIANELVLA